MLISFSAGSNIVYVGGRINGQSKVFEYRELLGLWVADVEQSENGSYSLILELVDAAGNRSNYEDTVSYNLPKFIFDRTAADVEERKKKGFLNAADLMRIEKNTELIGDYVGVPVVVKNWKRGDIPKVRDYWRIRENVEKIRIGYVIRADTPETPRQPLNTYQKWNDIERILFDMFWIYIGTINNFNYCGEDISCGEDIGGM